MTRSLLSNKVRPGWATGSARRALPALLCLPIMACGATLPTKESFDAKAIDVKQVATRDVQWAFTQPDACPVTQAGQAVAAAPTPGGSRIRAAGPLGVVGAALVPVAVDFAFKAVTDALTQARNNLTANYPATGIGDLAHACLIIVRGTIGPQQAGLPARSGVLETSHLAKLGLASYPSLYLEVGITRQTLAGGKTQYTMQPAALQFAKTAAPRAGDGRKDIGMAIVLRGKPADKPDKETTTKDAVAVIPFNFGVVAEGTALRMTGDGNSNPFLDQVRILAAMDASGPLNINAFVVESAEPEQVLKLLSATLDTNKSDIQKALTTALTDALKLNKEDSKK